MSPSYAQTINLPAECWGEVSFPAQIKLAPIMHRTLGPRRGNGPEKYSSKPLNSGIFKKDITSFALQKVTFQPKKELSRLGSRKDSTLQNICKAEIYVNRDLTHHRQSKQFPKTKKKRAGGESSGTGSKEETDQRIRIRI